MPRARYSAVTFDAGNTLLYCDPPPPVIYAHHVSRYGPSVAPDEAARVFGEAWADMQRRTPTGQDRYGSHPAGEREWWGAFVREVLLRLDHPAPWQQLLDDLYEAFSRPDVWQLFPDTRDTLHRLSEQSIRLAVISNWDRRLPEILGHLAIDGSFDVITVSSLEQLEKPSTEIFHRTLRRLSVAPERAIHVGDSPREDYQGSEDAGMTPVLIDREGVFAKGGYRRIERLDSLVDLVISP